MAQREQSRAAEDAAAQPGAETAGKASLPHDPQAIEAARKEREHKTFQRSAHKFQERRENDGSMNFGMRPEFLIYRNTQPALQNGRPDAQRSIQFQEQINRETSLSRKRERERCGTTAIDQLLAGLFLILPQHELSRLSRQLSEVAGSSENALELSTTELLTDSEAQIAKQVGADLPLHLHIRHQTEAAAEQATEDLSVTDERAEQIRNLLPQAAGKVRAFLKRDRSDSYSHLSALIDSTHSELRQSLNESKLPIEAQLACLKYFEAECVQVMTAKCRAAADSYSNGAPYRELKDYLEIVCHSDGAVKYRTPRSISLAATEDFAARIKRDFVLERAYIEARRASERMAAVNKYLSHFGLNIEKGLGTPRLVLGKEMSFDDLASTVFAAEQGDIYGRPSKEVILLGLPQALLASNPEIAELHKEQGGAAVLVPGTVVNLGRTPLEEFLKAQQAGIDAAIVSMLFEARERFDSPELRLDGAEVEAISSNQPMLRALAEEISPGKHSLPKFLAEAILLVRAQSEQPESSQKADNISPAGYAAYSEKALLKITQYAFETNELTDFIRLAGSLAREARLERGLNDDQRADLSNEILRFARARLLNYIEQAANNQRIIQPSRTGVVGSFYWPANQSHVAHFNQLLDLLKRPTAQSVRAQLGELGEDTEFVEQVCAVLRKCERSDHEAGLKQFAAETDRLRQGLLAAGVIFRSDSEKASAYYRVPEDTNLDSLCKKIFALGKIDLPDYDITRAHVELLAAGNQEMAGLLLSASPGEIMLPAGTELDISHLSAIRELSLRCAVEANTYAALESEGAASLSEEIKVISSYNDSYNQMAELVERLCFLQGLLSASSRAINLEPESGNYPFDTEVKLRLKSFERDIEALRAHVPDDLLNELRFKLFAVGASSAANFGVSLLAANRGDDARMAFEYSLRQTDRLLSFEGRLETKQVCAIRSLRVQVLERLRECALHDTQFQQLLKTAVHGGTAMNDATVARVLEEISLRTEQARTELIILGQHSHDHYSPVRERLLAADQHHSAWQVYSALGAESAAFSSLNSEAAVLLGLDSSEEGIFYFTDANLQICESQGIQVSGYWFGYDSLPGLSERRLTAILGHFANSEEVARRRFIELLPQLIAASLASKDEEQGVVRANCYRQIFAALLKQPEFSQAKNADLYRHMFALGDAQVRFAFGRFGKHKSAQQAALQVLAGAITGLQSFNDADPQRANLAALLFQQASQDNLSFRRTLALQGNADPADFSNALDAAVSTEEIRISADRKRFEELRESIRNQVEASGAASYLMQSEVLELERRIEAREEHCAKMRLEEALVYLETGHSEKAKATLLNLKGQYENSVEWVGPQINKLLETNNKGALLAMLQQTVSELSTATISPLADTGIYGGSMLVGAAVGYAVAAGFAVAGPAGAALGALLAPIVPFLGFKSWNLYRGSDRIGEAYRSGISAISARESLFDTMFLGLEVVNMVGPFKGAGALLSSAGRETVEQGARLALKEGAQGAAGKLSNSAYLRALSEGTEFGGRWLLALNATALAGPIGVQAVQIMLSDKLSAEEKRRLITELSGHASTLVLFAGSQVAATYYLNRWAGATAAAIGAKAEKAASLPEAALPIFSKPTVANTVRLLDTPALQPKASALEVLTEVGPTLRMKILDAESEIMRLQSDSIKPENARYKVLIAEAIEEARLALRKLASEAETIVADVRARRQALPMNDAPSGSSDIDDLPFEPPKPWNPDDYLPWSGDGGGKGGSNGGGTGVMTHNHAAGTKTQRKISIVKAIEEVPSKEPVIATKQQDSPGGPVNQVLEAVPAVKRVIVREVGVELPFDDGFDSGKPLIDNPAAVDVMPELKTIDSAAVKVVPAEIAQIDRPAVSASPVEFAPGNLPTEPLLIEPEPLAPTPKPDMRPAVRQVEETLPKPQEKPQSEEVKQQSKVAVSEEDEETKRRRRRGYGNGHAKEEVAPLLRNQVNFAIYAVHKVPPAPDTPDVMLERCQVCRGSGLVKCNSCGGRRHRGCIECSGLGLTRHSHDGGHSWNLCIVCDGSGKEDCPTCSSGSGSVRCAACGGTGAKRRVVY